MGPSTIGNVKSGLISALKRSYAKNILTAMQTPKSNPAVPKLFLDSCIIAGPSNKNLNSNQASSLISSQLESYQEMAKIGKEQVSTISPFFGMPLMAGRSRGSPSIHGYML